MSYDWLKGSKGRSKDKQYLSREDAVDHPLKAVAVSAIESRSIRQSSKSSQNSSQTSSVISLDPLSLDGFDPLSQIANEYVAIKLNDTVDTGDSSVAELWTTRRSTILNKYTTAEKLAIVSSFLHGGEVVKTQITFSEKVRNRLEQLDDFEDGSVRRVNNLTQQEYHSRIEDLNHQLIAAWKTDQRVKALKIAIQCTKLLADTSVISFYPTQFVLITDILDNFGKLVYERLRCKADYFEAGSNATKSLPENFTPDMVSSDVKETCMNWFYKIASIRELLPRLYLEIALLKSLSFLSQNEYEATLKRLCYSIRGIGDPLISAYARCYLCRVGPTVAKSSKFLEENLDDFLFIYHTILLGGLRTDLAHQRLKLTEYLGLYSPALDWMMQVLVMYSTDTVLDEVLTKCQDKKNNGLLFQSLLASFKPHFIAARANKFVAILSAGSNDGATKSQLFRLLGLSLCKQAPHDDQKLSVLNGTWRVITTLTQVSEFIACIEPWVEYASAHFGCKEIDTILSEIIARMNQNRAFEKHYSELESICKSIIENCKNLEALLISDNFLLFVDLFQKESIRTEVCKHILSAYKANVPVPTFENEANVSDVVVMNTLLQIAKHLNDGITASTSDDEQRQVTQLISHFVRTMCFGRDFEVQLLFYVEARAAFPNLDGVFVTLVHCVNLLANKTHRIVNGRHTRKTSTFVKSCAAFCFITIPSIASVRTRLDLYLVSGQVALLNLCFGQADALLETAVHLIKEVPRTSEVDGKQKSTDNYLIAFVSNLLSTLIVTPDSPEQGVLYLVRTLLDTTTQLAFEPENSCTTRLYLLILEMLLTATHDKYPYHIPNVISNDELYGSDPKFIDEVHSLCSNVVELILVQLKTLGNTNQRAQCQFALELFLKLASNANLCGEKTFTFTLKLWNLAMKNRKLVDAKIPGKFLIKIENITKRTDDPQMRHAFEELMTKMKVKM